MHEDLVPPDTLEGYSDEQMLEWKTEFDVVTTLKNMGHEVLPLGLLDDLGAIRRAIIEWKPHVAFNLCEEFHGVGVYDQHVVSFLELMRQAYTGCNPRGLLLSRDKALTKKILTYHRIPTPRFLVVARGRKSPIPKKLRYPLVVKSISEDASLGITPASIVHDPGALDEQIKNIHDDVGTDALVEEFIEGRELYVGVMGNERLQTFPIWELQFTKADPSIPTIATGAVKWDIPTQKRLGVETNAATDLPPGAEEKIHRLTKRIYRALTLSGYARMDFRLTPEGQPFVLEANPNPNLSFGEDFAESAESAGVSYEDVIRRIISLGRRYKAPWHP